MRTPILVLLAAMTTVTSSACRDRSQSTRDVAAAGATSVASAQSRRREIDEASLCRAFDSLASGIEADVRAAAANERLQPAEALAVLRRATPAGSRDAMASVLAAQGLDPHEVASFIQTHPDAAQRCTDRLVARMNGLEEPLQRVAAMARNADAGGVVTAPTMPSTDASAGGPSATIAWTRSDPTAALASAASAGHRAIVLFCAPWAVACEELRHTTFADARVAAAVRARYVAVEIDDDGSPNAVADALRARFRVRGLPTIVLLDEHGVELHRFTRPIDAATLLAAL